MNRQGERGRHCVGAQGCMTRCIVQSMSLVHLTFKFSFIFIPFSQHPLFFPLSTMSLHILHVVACYSATSSSISFLSELFSSHLFRYIYIYIYIYRILHASYLTFEQNVVPRETLKKPFKQSFPLIVSF